MPAIPTNDKKQREGRFVAVIGGANVDIHGESVAPLRLNDSNPGSVRITAGGVGRNVAENLARLGVDCRLVSVVGDDEHGRFLLQATKDAGVDVSHVHVSSTAPTSTYLSVIDAGGEMKVAVSDMRIAEELTPERLRSHASMLQAAASIVIDTNLPAETLAWIAGKFADKPIFVDTVSTAKAVRIREHLGAVHTLKANALEAAALTGSETRTIPQLEQAAQQLHAAGVTRVFLTRGSDGVFYSAGGDRGSVASGVEALAVRNTTGAGDAFLAGLVCAELDNLDIRDAVNIALARAQEKIA